MNGRPLSTVALVLAAAAILAGCGYRFAGTDPLPAGVDKVAVRTLNNATAEPGLGSRVAAALADELARRGRLSAHAADAEAFLSGTVKRLWTEAASRKSQTVAAQRRLAVTASFFLEDGRAGRLWAADDVSAQQVYDVIEGDEAATDARREQALEQAVRRLAEEVWRRMTERF